MTAVAVIAVIVAWAHSLWVAYRVGYMQAEVDAMNTRLDALGGGQT